MKLIAQIKYK